MNNQCSLPPSIPRLSWDPWARHRTPNCSPDATAICVCVFTAVCVRLDGLNAEHKFLVWVTISGHMSLHFTSLSLNSFMSGCANHFTPDCFLNEGQIKAGFVEKLKLKDGSVPIVHDPAAPPEEASLTLISHNIFNDYLRIAFALPQKRGAGWAEFISM